MIRIDSFPDFEFQGKIEKIADLARTDYGMETKSYPAIITIDRIPKGVKLKPGMTAETEILVRTLDDVVAIPVQAVTEHLGTNFCFVKQSNGYERRKIEIRDGNESFLIADSGIAENDEVALDAYQRGLKEFESLSNEETAALKEAQQKRIEEKLAETRAPEITEIEDGPPPKPQIVYEAEKGKKDEANSEVGKTSGEVKMKSKPD